MDERGLELYPEQASSFAAQIDHLYFFLWAVSGFFTLLIFVLIVYFAVRYRRRRDDDLTVPRPVHGSLMLEIAWTGIPFIFVMIFFFWGAKLYFTNYRPPPGAMEIQVVGKQWMWKTQHPTGTREINTLHVPVGRPVKLIMSSQDVIHSFFIPAFRVKMDVIPGRYTVTWFRATKAGEYHLFCTEYCGKDHSRMVGKVVVMEPEKYEAWLNGTIADAPPAASGERLFQTLGCATCHAAQAPSMAGLYMSEQKLADGRVAVADENYLRRSILDSTDDIVAGYQPIMPSFRGQVSEEQLGDLIAYIKSLRDRQQGEQVPVEGGLPRSQQPEPGGMPPRRPQAPVAPGNASPGAVQQ